MVTQMDSLTAFGVVSVTAMLAFYALEDRSPWFVLAFAGACMLASVYGFLQGAWPFGLVEAVWSLVAFRRWRARSITVRGLCFSTIRCRRSTRTPKTC